MDITKNRILGISVRASWLGYAAIDRHGNLVDWGMIYCQRKSAATIKAAKRRIESVIIRINPSHVSMLLPELSFYRNSSSVRSFTRAVQTAASLYSIPSALLQRNDVRAAFTDLATRSKDEIASEIARRFPELAWKLPPKRKRWKKEDSRLAIFDAVATALAFAQNGKR